MPTARPVPRRSRPRLVRALTTSAALAVAVLTIVPVAASASPTAPTAPQVTAPAAPVAPTTDAPTADAATDAPATDAPATDAPATDATTAGTEADPAPPTAGAVARTTPEASRTATAAVVGEAEVAQGAVAAADVQTTVPSTSVPGFKSLVPQRVLDTRSGLGVPGAVKGAIGAGRTVELDVTGRGGVPATNVTAVVLNVTATGASQSTYVSVYPAGAARPPASSLNLAARTTVANLVVAKVGSNGNVVLFNAAGTVNLVVDVQGWFDPTPDFTPLTPSRLVDTRANNAPALPAGGSVTVPVLGRGGVPASGVVAVALNVTATAPTGSGFFTVFPTGGAKPPASNLNYTAGRTVAVAAFSQVGDGGAVTVYTSTPAHAIVDVTGWFAVDGTYVPLPPARMYNTQADYGSMEPGDQFDMQVTGFAGVPTAGAAAVVLSVTAVRPTAAGYLTEWPYKTSLPPVSSLNFPAGQTTANLVIAKVGPGGFVSVYNPNGFTHLIVDVLGYFTTDATPVFGAGAVVVASVDENGQGGPGSADTCRTGVSDDGRYVLFTSTDRTMAPWPVSEVDLPSVYVRDTVLGVTNAVFLPAGAERACSLAISPDGRWALWTSNAARVEGDSNNTTDVFQTDLTDGMTYHVSWNPDENLDAPGNAASTRAAQSPDGRFVAFQTAATNLLTTPDTNGVQDVLLADMDLGTITRVGVGDISTGAVTDAGKVVYTAKAATPDGSVAAVSAPVLFDPAANAGAGSWTLVQRTSGDSPVLTGGGEAYLDADGDTVVFSTTAALVPGDTNNAVDVYVRRIGTAPSALASGSATAPGSGTATAGPVSASGAAFVFGSNQSGLLSGVTGTHGYLWTGALGLATRTAGGTAGDGVSGVPSLSGDGLFAAFETSAANLGGVAANRVVVKRLG